VAFKLLQGMLRTHEKNNTLLPNGARHEAFEKWQLDMAAIASVADMVPLIGESRTLTKFGLIVLNKTKRIGLQKLLLEARIMEADGSMKNEIDADTIGFRIAPRINAAGRMEHANVAYKLLVEEKPNDAIDLAYRLDQNNTERQQMTETLVDEALEQIKKQMDSPILFALGHGWPTGIIGLIASRLKERFQKPAIIMARNAEGDIVGSGRSVTGFNFVLAMQTVPEQFHKFGGHPMAGGFTLSKETTVELFKEAMLTQYAVQTKNQDMTPIIEIDGKITLEEVSWELYDTLEKFKPFGMANPKPKYLAEKVKVIGIEPLGKDGKHMRLMVQHTTNKIRKTVGWNFCAGADQNWCQTLRAGDLIDMLFEVGVNEWNGTRELQLTVVDLKKCIY
jgi:single-stranded-DNA-specific exonuclease